MSARINNVAPGSAPLKIRDDPGSPNAGPRLIAQRPQPLDHQRRRPMLRKSQLGMAVQLPTRLDQLRLKRHALAPMSSLTTQRIFATLLGNRRNPQDSRS